MPRCAAPHHATPRHIAPSQAKRRGNRYRYRVGQLEADVPARLQCDLGHDPVAHVEEPEPRHIDLRSVCVRVRVDVCVCVRVCVCACVYYVDCELRIFLKCKCGDECGVAMVFNYTPIRPLTCSVAWVFITHSRAVPALAWAAVSSARRR
jgi:hypothetical protein